MRIAILSFYSGHLDRGVETWTHELANRLSKDKYEITVLQNGKTRPDADYAVVETDLPVNSRGSRFGESFFLDYWSFLIARFTFKVLPYLWREKFDVVIPTNGRWQALLVRLVTLFCGSKMVVVGHSGVTGRDEIWNAWNFPNAYVGLSSYAREWAKKVNPFIRVSYIPNGVDLQKFKYQYEKIRTGLKRSVILYVGALEPQKRPLLAIRAVAQMKDVSLLMVGKGNLKEEVLALGRKLLGKRFSLKAFPYNKMPAVYRTADVFTNPSTSGYSFEIVLLEAMATNLPVVANNDPVRREIIGDAGILVDPENNVSYSRALIEAVNQDWGERPRTQARKFSWDKVAGQYKDLFDKLVR